MIKWIGRLGSLAFVIGFFAIVFAVVPWVVTVVDDPTLGGPLPWWVKGAVYCMLGGIALVLICLAVGQFLRAPTTAVPPAEGGPPAILMENTGLVSGQRIAETLGLVKGHTIYAIWLGKDISALMRMLLGGELTEYTEMMGKAREVALERMSREAAELGANAVVNVRFMTTSVVGTAAELLAYGTAVRLAPASE